MAANAQSAVSVAWHKSPSDGNWCNCAENFSSFAPPCRQNIGRGLLGTSLRVHDHRAIDAFRVDAYCRIEMRQQAQLHKVLHEPLMLDLSPTFPQCHAGSSSNLKRASFAIYVEPPAAPGLNEILPVLRTKVRADVKPSRASLCYSALAGHGLARTGGTAAWVGGESIDGSGEQVATAFLRYRLVVTDRLEPIGYCTFSLCIHCDASIEIEVYEVWLEARYRGIALGRALAGKIASIAMTTLEQVDGRAGEVGLKSLYLWPLVCGDVYSNSGARFVKDVASALAFETRYATWFSIEVGNIACDLRW